MQRTQGQNIILRGKLVGGVFVFANVSTHHQASRAVFQSLGRCHNPVVVESHAVDQTSIFGETEQTRLRIARLGFGRQGSNLYKSKTQGPQGRYRFRILVQSCSQAHRVGKCQSRHHKRL